jgi:hypothetical protein
VVVSAVGKPPGSPNSESKIAFYSIEHQALCTLDYSSEDGEHGFGLVKAEWTPDGQYFVFGLSESGSSPVKTPSIFFFSAKNNTILPLDRFLKSLVLDSSDFTLKGPNTVLVRAGNAWTKAASVSLALSDVPQDGQGADKPLACNPGTTVKRGSLHIQ